MSVNWIIVFVVNIHESLALILGIGIDIVDIGRIRKAEKRWGQRFLSRVFTEGEVNYSVLQVSPHPRLAARFAAKEAASKALGTGLTLGVTWKDIEVLNNANGRPEIILHGKAREMASAKGIRNIHLSISHDGNYAAAQVILEG